MRAKRQNLANESAATRRYDAAVSEIDYHKDQESIVLIGKADTCTRTTGKVMDQHQRGTPWLIFGAWEELLLVGDQGSSAPDKAHQGQPRSMPRRPWGDTTNDEYDLGLDIAHRHCLTIGSSAD